MLLVEDPKTLSFFVILLSSIAVCTPNGQFLHCVAIAFRERYIHFDTPLLRAKYFYCGVLSCDDVRPLLADKQVLCVTRLIAVPARRMMVSSSFSSRNTSLRSAL